MDLQSSIVALLVAGCSVYAAWKLMPAALRRAIAGALTKLPLPAKLAAPLQRAAQTSGGCGCDGCDHAAPRAKKNAASRVVKSKDAADETTQPLHFHPRPPR
jgi:hypothetical protein